MESTLSISNSPKQSYPVAVGEIERINKLRKYQVLNEDEEPAFDRLVELVKLFFDVPVVTITFMDEETQYLKPAYKFETMSESVSTAPREMAFCNYTILSDDVLIVPDTLEDSRFSQSPMVTGSPYLRFYVGAPILLYEDKP